MLLKSHDFCHKLVIYPSQNRASGRLGNEGLNLSNGSAIDDRVSMSSYANTPLQSVGIGEDQATARVCQDMPMSGHGF
jgi:hypothetical protein